MSLKFDPFKTIDSFETVQFQDVDEKVIKFIVKMIEKAKFEEREINWIDFKKYCMSFDAPLEVRVPENVVDRCMEEARRRKNEI